MKMENHRYKKNTKMNSEIMFDEVHVLHNLTHYLPAQNPLKDFVHHNTLHAFQKYNFFDAMQKANTIFDYKTYLTLPEFRKLFQEKKIDESIVKNILEKYKKNASEVWFYNLTEKCYPLENIPRIGSLRKQWKEFYQINIEKSIQTLLFRLVSNYLDQGIGIWDFPKSDTTFIEAIKWLEKNSYSSIFKTERAKKLLHQDDLSLEILLKIVVGNPLYYEGYLFDQQFTHPGWSGMVAVIEQYPITLLDTRKISLKDFIILELLLEIDTLDAKFGEIWMPLGLKTSLNPNYLFETIEKSELFEVLSLWQKSYEWTYFDQVLSVINFSNHQEKTKKETSFAALFCIDDRICSIRRHLEHVIPTAKTYGTAGFFNVEFFYKPLNGKFYTKLCPAPVTPKFLIKEIGEAKKQTQDLHFHKSTHSLLLGWLIAQTLGFYAAIQLFMNIFRPKISASTSSSFSHTNLDALFSIEFDEKEAFENDLQIGYKLDEMTTRVEGLLRSIGLLSNFPEIIYVVAHGATSVNNTHYAGYDCGACSGRPGNINAQVISYMANHKKVRASLAEKGILIPEKSLFIAALHDTTRDEILFFDKNIDLISHQENQKYFEIALQLNAKERSRRFESIETVNKIEKVHEKVKERSVSLFEPRPELNHATNCLCIVGNRTMTEDVFLDRRSFLNSYNYQTDLDGTYLLGILKAVAPVCGGINLEYYFSRVDNQKLGAGTKLPHNVIGLFGVSNGIEGDLRTGLPLQMIEVHDPLRLMVVVEHFPEIVLNTIQKDKNTYEWFKNDWIVLIAINPENKKQYLFDNEFFTERVPLNISISKTDNLELLFEKSSENLPTLILNH
jgi:uncharacterized protein YbcC (UPF0753/DUF2309 family)